MQKISRNRLPDRTSANNKAQPPDAKEFKVLKIICHYGHLRLSEVARAVWPKSKQGTAEKLTRRIVARLLTWRFLHELPDAHGGFSLVLSSRGAACLREWGENALSGSQYSLNHPSFRHRWVGTRYLIERGALGDDAYGFHALITEQAPVGRAELTQRFGLLPDGLVLMANPTDSGIQLADWVKVIWSRFSMHDLERLLAIEQHVGAWLNAKEDVRLGRVLFLCDAESSWLIRALKRYLLAHPRPDRDLQKIVVIRCRVEPSLLWDGYEEIDCASLLQGGPVGLEVTV